MSRASSGPSLRLRALRAGGLLAATAGVISINAACTTFEDRQKIWRAAEAIDDVNHALDQYGSASVGASVLFKPDDTFKFDLKKDGDFFFDEARKSFQGRAALLNQSVLQAGLGVDVAADPTIAAKYAADVAKFQAAQAANAQRGQIIDQQSALKGRAAQITFQQALRDAAAEPDPTKRAAMQADAFKALADSKDVPAEQDVAFPDSPPAPKSASIEVPNADKAVSRFSSQTLAAMGGLLGDDHRETKLASRSAIITAAGDNATAAMFRALGRPDLIEKFSDRTVLFAVTNVSVNPGWQTQKGYMAEVSLGAEVIYDEAKMSLVREYVSNKDNQSLLRYEVAKGANLPEEVIRKLMAATTAGGNESNADYMAAKAAYESGDSANLTADSKLSYSIQGFRPSEEPKIKRPGRLAERGRLDWESVLPADDPHAPQLMVVSPLTDTQSLDLASSLRERSETALSIAGALSLAGFSGQAKSFLSYAKDLEADVATATARNVVNTSSSPDGHVSYQVGPQFVAIEKIKENGKPSGPAETLDRQSFPSLLLMSFPHSDLSLKLKYEGDENATTAKERGRLVLYEAKVRLRTSNRWVPLSPSRGSFSTFQRAQLAYHLSKRVESANILIAEKEDKWKNLNSSKGGLGLGPEAQDQRRIDSAIVNAGKYLRDSYAPEARYRAFGTFTELSLPDSVVFPKAEDKPKDTLAVSPSEVEVGKGGIDTFAVALTGAKFGDEKKIVVKRLDNDAIIPGTVLVGDSLLVKLPIAAGAQPTVIYLSVTAGDEKKTRYLSKPILVRAAPSDYLITRSKREGEKETPTDVLRISPNTPADIAKAEIEKAKPAAKAEGSEDKKTTNPGGGGGGGGGNGRDGGVSFQGSVQGTFSPTTRP